MTDERLTRRAVLHHGVAAIAFVCTVNHRLRPVPHVHGVARSAQQAPGVFDPFQVDLPVPPVARPISSTPALDRYVITMRPGTANILKGLETPILGYDGLFPGPTVHATRGRPVEVRQINASGRDLNVHLHGGITEPHSDGHPLDFIPDGQERLYHYASTQRSATLWYHDHSHGQTSRTLFAGLAGTYIVRDPAEDALELPQGEYDLPLMLTDRSFNADGSFRYRVDIDAGFRGDTILVNGAIAPRVRVERRLYRLRFINASNARPYALVLGNQREMIQIASDGGLLPKPVVRPLIPLQPAERVDVLVDFRQFGVGSEVVLRNTAGEPSTTSVLRFDVVRGGAEEARVPDVLADVPQLPPVNAQRGFPLTFQGLGGAQWQIGGLGFDALRVDCRPRFGSSELWAFENFSGRLHPMHLHGYHFKVVSLSGKPPHPGDAGWKDTVAVWPGQRVVIRPDFEYFTGRYVFHCHAAEHGDMAMMGQMEVVA
jgi:spore coat protein A, manganese oxidase